MRTKLSLILIIASLTMLPALTAKTPDRVTGQDWLLMSGADKVTCLSSVIDLLQKRGVPLARSAKEYVEAVNQLSDNSKMLSVDVANIFASYIYETEPASRAALDLILKKPTGKKAQNALNEK